MRELRKLPPTIKPRVLSAIYENSREAILRHQARRRAPRCRFRWRVGRYRIIYLIDDHRELVVFLDVGHTRSVYKA